MKKRRHILILLFLSVFLVSCAVNQPGSEQVIPVMKSSTVQTFLLAQVLRWGPLTNANTPYTITSFSIVSNVTNFNYITNYSVTMADGSGAGVNTDTYSTNIKNNTNWTIKTDHKNTQSFTNYLNTISTNTFIQTNVLTIANMGLRYNISGYSAYLDSQISIYKYAEDTNLTLSLNTYAKTPQNSTVSYTNILSTSTNRYVYLTNFITNLSYYTNKYISTNISISLFSGLEFTDFATFKTAFANASTMQISGKLSYTNNVDGSDVYMNSWISNYGISSGDATGFYTNESNIQLDFNGADNFYLSSGTIQSGTVTVPFDVYYQNSINLALIGNQTNLYEMLAGSVPSFVSMGNFTYSFNSQYVFNTNITATLSGIDRYPNNAKISVDLLTGE